MNQSWCFCGSRLKPGTGFSAYILVHDSLLTIFMKIAGKPQPELNSLGDKI